MPTYLWWKPHPQEEWEERISWLQTCYGAGQVCGLMVAAVLTQMPVHTGGRAVMASAAT